MPDTVSVIVPIYKIDEEYLHQAIKSIQTQTFSDIEIILIDDGSPDQSGELCDRYALQDKRIRVIHKENGGVSAARNEGVKIARGEWICFLDPDDWMAPDALEKMLGCAETTGSEIVIGTFQFYHEKSAGDIVPFKKYIQVLNGEQLKDYTKFLVCPHYEKMKYHRRYWGKAMQGVPWGRIYSKRLWEQGSLLFPLDMHPSEDVIFNIAATMRARKIALLNECVYFYRINKGSITIGYKETWLQNQFLFLHELENLLLKINEPDTQHIFNSAVIGTVGALLQRYYFHPENPSSVSDARKELKQLYETKYLQVAIKDSSNPYYNGKQRIVRLFFMLNLWCGLKWLVSLKKFLS